MNAVGHRSRTHRIVLAACCLMTLTGSAMAADRPAKTPAQPADRYETNIQKLKSGIEIHLGKLQVAGQQEFDLLGEIERLDQELSLQGVRLQVMQERRDSQKELLADKLRELEESRSNRATVQQHLQTRLRAFYLTGKTGILNVTFSSRTLPELMLFNDSFKQLLDYDHAIVARYWQAIDQLTQATAAHEEESGLLDQFIARTVTEQEKLDTVLVEKKELLKKVKTEKVLHEQALKEMRRAETDLQKTLLALRKERERPAAPAPAPPPAEEAGIVLDKGRLAPPVAGTIIGRFGDKQEDKVLTGLVIDAANGAEIRAIADGKIIFAGYRRGYGNMVIIDHGQDYYTITARMEKLKGLSGNTIGAGEVIGIAGEIATLFDKGVYFEIRHEAEPEDPLAWITMQGLREEGPPQ